MSLAFDLIWECFFFFLPTVQRESRDRQQQNTSMACHNHCHDKLWFSFRICHCTVVLG